MSIPIKKALEKVPGGMMLVPLGIGAVIHTLAPDAGKFFGSFTGAFFTGLTPLLAVFFVCLGATLEVKSTPYILKRAACSSVPKSSSPSLSASSPDVSSGKRPSNPESLPASQPSHSSRP